MSDEFDPELIAKLTNVSPQGTALGLQVVRLEKARGTMHVPWREELVGDPDAQVIAGGVVTTLLDQTCGLALRTMFDKQYPGATLDLRIDYLRPAAPHAGVTAEAHCYRVTRNIAFIRAHAWDVDPEDPLATAQAAFALTEAAL